MFKALRPIAECELREIRFRTERSLENKLNTTYYHRHQKPRSHFVCAGQQCYILPFWNEKEKNENYCDRELSATALSISRVHRERGSMKKQRVCALCSLHTLHTAIQQIESCGKRYYCWLWIVNRSYNTLARLSAQWPQSSSVISFSFVLL